MLDESEWIDNSYIIAHEWELILSMNYDNDNINFLDKNFIEIYLKIFKLINEKFKLNEKTEFVYPIYFLLSFLNEILNLKKGREICNEKNLLYYLIDYYLNNVNFSNMDFDKQYFFGDDYAFTKNTIYNIFLNNIWKLLSERKHKYDEILAGKLTDKINYLCNLTEINSNSNQYIIMLRLLNTQQLLFDHNTSKNLKIHKKIFECIFVFLKEFQEYSTNQNPPRQLELQVSLNFLVNYLFYTENMDKLFYENKEIFTNLLLSSHRKFYGYLIECLFQIYFSGNDDINHVKNFVIKFPQLSVNVNPPIFKQLIFFGNEKVFCKKKLIFSSQYEKINKFSTIQSKFFKKIFRFFTFLIENKFILFRFKKRKFKKYFKIFKLGKS